MSVSSILAFLLLGTRAFTGARDRAEEKPTRPSYAELKARVAELEADIAIANAQARRDQNLIDMWRERTLAGRPQPILQSRPAHIDYYELARQQCQAQAALQQMANQAQSAKYNQAMQKAVYGNSLLGAQNLITAELWCNCVPSRSQVWANSDPE